MTQVQAELPFIRTASRLRIAFWKRRVVRWMVRAAWLALLVPTMAMVGYLWLDWDVSWPLWIFLMFLVGFLAILWSLRPINLKKMAYRLDNLLEMQARLVTAYEVSYASDPAMAQEENPVVDQLIQNTVNIAATIRQKIRLFGRGFWIEMHTLVAISAILGSMLIFNALTSNIPDMPPVDLPIAGQEPPANDVVPPSSQPPPPDDQDMDQEDLLSALEILADALRDQAITRSISEAIDRNDLGTAAAEVRRLADQLDGLSKDARRQFGDNMQEAADKIGDGVPDLTNPLEKGNQALDTNDLPQANQALEELAEFLDSLDDTPPDQPPSSQPEEPEKIGVEEEEIPDNNPPPEAEERLPIDGQELELESDSESEEQVLQPSELEAQDDSEETSDATFSRQPLNPPNDDLGPDPLTYPWQKREIIRQYFTP